MTRTLFTEIQDFLSFGDDDRRLLLAMAPIIERHGADITAAFYAVLGRNPTTRALIEGRVDRLKATHQRWMSSLVSGDYGDAWSDSQIRIGNVHVMLGISPLHVELTFSLLRDNLLAAVRQEVADGATCLASQRALVKVLDMSLALVNHAYAEERLNRLSGFTGFSRKLIENCINKTARAA